ncbi:penicillin-binding protein [Bifidobacterium ramosum]|uniref:Penicillin-binding protein n=1 Tax=Bifidobacterium ramosum TaxID=1798158 RepID=A0A6L4X1F5_9BIFI|nr:transglycosylase domain-containing protein [Bifidobacterium ramosum]KAB8288364.1 penicillin-binding protein [Bifidobacterium ramosum]NEG71599.1 penicillin-binding protein [Bifidobacterium ramosum]
MVSQSRRTSGGSHRAGSTPRSASSRTTRKPAARHYGGGSHRATGPTRHSRGNRNRNGRSSRHPILKWILIILGSLIGLGILGGAGAFAYLYITTEIPQADKIALASKTTVYYSDGTTEIGSFAEQNREIIQCTDLPDYVGNAIVASEDRTFYTNKGIDLKGMARALYNNVTTGSRQGGSTITQQYAERYYIGATTTSYVGKAREAILALKLAQSQDKSEILCNYMNTIYLGRGAYGIQAAAQAYFNKDAKDLSLNEAAMIAGIIPSPSSWDPAVDSKMATQRMKRVLNIMAEDGYITSGERSKADSLPKTVEYTQNNVFGGYNGYLLTTVENELIGSGTFTKDDIETGGYTIVTTLDKTLQEEIQTVGDTRPDGMPESIQVGGIAADPRDGTVKAIYAGSDYLTHQLNNATQATFQPGSTMKPFALLGAAQEGVNFNTLFNGNSHQHFAGITAEVNNALGNNWGNINLYQATANSVNTVFMNVNEHLTPQRTAEIAHQAGIESDIDETSPYNVLGINASTVWDLTQGHSTIAANGVKNTLHVVATVTDSAKKEVYKTNAENEKVFDANDCALVQKAMQGTTTNGTAAGTAAALGRAVAGKSGTANDETAASFVGYVPQLINVWAIWNPADDGTPQVVPEFAGYGVSSTGYPAHLFTEFMTQALSGVEVENFPTATDDGKIGGPDGTWGLGSTYYQQQQDAAKKKAQEEADAKKKAEEQQSQQSQSGTGAGDGSGDGNSSSTNDGNSTTGGNSGTGTGNGSTTDGSTGTGGTGSTEGGTGTGNTGGTGSTDTGSTGNGDSDSTANGNAGTNDSAGSTNQ